MELAFKDAGRAAKADDEWAMVSVINQNPASYKLSV